jgi:hypothetical protein
MATRISGGSFGQAETISAISKPSVPPLCGAVGGDADFSPAHPFLGPAASTGAVGRSSPLGHQKSFRIGKIFVRRSLGEGGLPRKTNDFDTISWVSIFGAWTWPISRAIRCSKLPLCRPAGVSNLKPSGFYLISLAQTPLYFRPGCKMRPPRLHQSLSFSQNRRMPMRRNKGWLVLGQILPQFLH